MIDDRQISLTVILFGSFLIIGFLRHVNLEGKILLGFAVLSLVAFFRVHLYLLLLTSMALFAFIAVALVWVLIGSSRLKVVRVVQMEALVGENVPVGYEISTKSSLPLFHVRIWDFAHRFRPSGEKEIDEFVDPGYLSFLKIGRDEKSTGNMHIVPDVRGKMRFGPVAIEGSDPFGIFLLTRWITVNDEVLVLPLWVRLSRLPAILARMGSREQIHPVNREGHSHEFLGIRAWSEGDSLRRVHWPLTARHDRLIVRQFQKEIEEELTVILDADRRADIGKGVENAFECMVTLALSMIHAATETGRPWTFLIVSDEIVKFSHLNRDSIKHVQYVLAELIPTRETGIENYADEIRRAHQSVGYALITPRTDYGPAAVLANLSSDGSGASSSLLIRVDPMSFAVGIEGGAEILKRRRDAESARSALPSDSTGAAPSLVTEIVYKRGNSIEELFLPFGAA